MQIVITVMGQRFVIDDSLLYNFLKNNGQTLDIPNHTREAHDNDIKDDKVLLKG